MKHFKHPIHIVLNWNTTDLKTIGRVVTISCLKATGDGMERITLTLLPSMSTGIVDNQRRRDGGTKTVSLSDRRTDLTSVGMTTVAVTGGSCITIFSKNKNKNKNNQPDRATMRPGCVSVCIDHATYLWRDRWTNRRVKRLKTC